MDKMKLNIILKTLDRINTELNGLAVLLNKNKLRPVLVPVKLPRR